MIDLTFGEGAAGALKLAKSMRHGEITGGALARMVIGGTRKQRRRAAREMRLPRAWTGVTMLGSPEEVACMMLDLDVGPLGGMAQSLTVRMPVLRMLYDHFDDVDIPIYLMHAAEKALSKLKKADATDMPVRVWVSPSNPAELMGLYYVCHILPERIPLSVIYVPEETENGGEIDARLSASAHPPELLGAYEDLEKQLSPIQRAAYGAHFQRLAEEDAPLRAFVNGALVSVPESFYDFALRENMPEGPFHAGVLIGRTLNAIGGVSDRWLYRRVLRMIQTGEMDEIEPSRDGNPYSGMMKYCGT